MIAVFGRTHEGYAMSERIGFIGLGLMGAGFTKRLIATGHEVTGYDPDPARMDEAVNRGARPAAPPAAGAQAPHTIPIRRLHTGAPATPHRGAAPARARRGARPGAGPRSGPQ